MEARYRNEPPFWLTNSLCLTKNPWCKGSLFLTILQTIYTLLNTYPNKIFGFISHTEIL